MGSASSMAVSMSSLNTASSSVVMAVSETFRNAWRHSIQILSQLFVVSWPRLTIHSCLLILVQTTRLGEINLLKECLLLAVLSGIANVLQSRRIHPGFARPVVV